jgi:hypothetical protein
MEPHRSESRIARLTLAFLLAGFLLAAILDATLQYAAGSTRPTVTWAFQSTSIRAGTDARLQYHVQKILLARDKLLIAVNQDAQWTNLATLTPNRNGGGTWRSQAEPIGQYVFRLEIVSPSGALVAAQSHALSVLGRVPLTAILGSLTNTVQIASRRYAYSWSESGWSVRTVFLESNSSCRSLTLTAAYVLPAVRPNLADIATLVLIQHQDTKTVNVPAGRIVTLNSRLSSGPFELVVENVAGTVYGNGWASCSTVNGRA